MSRVARYGKSTARAGHGEELAEILLAFGPRTPGDGEMIRGRWTDAESPELA